MCTANPAVGFRIDLQRSKHVFLAGGAVHHPVIAKHARVHRAAPRHRPPPLGTPLRTRLPPRRPPHPTCPLRSLSLSLSLSLSAPSGELQPPALRDGVSQGPSYQRGAPSVLPRLTHWRAECDPKAHNAFSAELFHGQAWCWAVLGEITTSRT